MNLLLAPNSALLYISALLSLVCLASASAAAPWRELARVSIRQHLWYFTCFGLAVFWMMEVQVREVLAFHPMLITVTVMLFGLRLALVAGAVAVICQHLLMQVFQQQGLWSTMPVEYLLQVIIPAGWASLVIGFINRLRFKNPFTYFLGVGFFGAGLSVQIVMICAEGLFWVTNAQHYLEVLNDNYLITLLLMFPEGFINGMLATMLTVLHPDLLRTYRDDWFLD